MSEPIPPAADRPAAEPAAQSSAAPAADYSAYASAPRASTPGSPDAAKNPLGLFSAIAGAVGVLLGAFFTLIQATIAGTGNYSALGAVGAFQTVLTVLLGLAAIVLGGIALLTRRGSRVWAAVGVALGVSFLISAIAGLLYTFIIQVTARY